MKAFSFLILAILFGCVSKESRKIFQDSIPVNDSTPAIDSTSKINENPFPDRTERKTYSDGDLRIEEEILYTMKGQDAFYKIINSVKALNQSTGLVLWDSTLIYELGDSLRFPYFYTSFPACCASIEGYSIRDAQTGHTVVRYTSLHKAEGFDFQIGYNAIRSAGFNDGPFRNAEGILMGTIFTLKSKVKSKLEIRHQGKEVEYAAFPPSVSILSKQSILNELKDSEIYINQSKGNSIPSNQYFIRLSYEHQPPVIVYVPIDEIGNLSPICITTSIDRDWLFNVKSQLKSN